MKKPTPRWKFWHINRARNQVKRSALRAMKQPTEVSVWREGELFSAELTGRPSKPPQRFCLDENFVGTSAFLESLRRRMLSRPLKNQTWLKKPKNANQRPKMRTFYDFAQIEHMGVTAALVLAAEYARASKIIGESPTIINIEEWNQGVFQTLFEIGFFDAVGIGDNTVSRLTEPDSDRKVLRLFSDYQENSAKAHDSLQELARFIAPNTDLPLEATLSIMSAISEAMINVTQHAYPEGYKFKFRTVRKWWITGSANKKTKTITIAIYDQGATIPVTYPEKHWTAELASFVGLANDGNPFALDGKMIEAATRFGSSRTDAPQRGKGLPQMKQGIAEIGTGRLRILSRGGEYLYEAGGQERTLSHPVSIGGTLVQWTVCLDKVAA